MKISICRLYNLLVYVVYIRIVYSLQHMMSSIETRATRSCDFPIFPYAPTILTQYYNNMTTTSASTNTININDINSGKVVRV